MFMGLTISSQADTNQTKCCTRCKVEKPVAQFYFKPARGVYEPRCKDCIALINREYYEKNHNGGVCPHVSEGSETIRKE